jgi:hypothetical protein
MKVNEEKTQAIYFCHHHKPVETRLTLIGRNIPFVSHIKYLDVIVDRKTWRLHIEAKTSKAFRTFLRVYSLQKIERLSTNIKLTIHKAFIKSVMTYACPGWEFAAGT